MHTQAGGDTEKQVPPRSADGVARRNDKDRGGRSICVATIGVGGTVKNRGSVAEKQVPPRSADGVACRNDKDWVGRWIRLTVVLLFVFIFVLDLGTTAWAITYYVSSSTGSDANGGTSSAAAWATIAHVNAQTFQPGDSILFKRGDVWNESLAPPSSGASGNPIAFDAYGTGAAPNLTGYYAVPPSAWQYVTGNAWKAHIPSTYTTVNFCLFGSVWGQKVPAVSSNLTAQWDFYLANGYLYVYSAGNPALHYNAPIVPMALSNVPVINSNGQSWLTFQHFLLNWFDQYGVYVQGTSDHLVFANMEADSMIPQGTQPLGFYVNESAPGPGDIKIYNSESHLNYDGFRFDGAATAITMVNDKAYGNRDGAVVDNLSYTEIVDSLPVTVDDSAALTYSYCHFYASSLAVAGSTDVEWATGLNGPTVGVRNIPQDTPPAVQVWQRYPARVSLTVDDIGMTPGADTYYGGTVVPIADAAAVPVGVAVTTGYTAAMTPPQIAALITEIQGWINGGRDVTSHSVSHTYYTNTDALDIQYTGTGTAATLNISNNVLTITVTGAPADGVSYNLTNGQPQGTIGALYSALFNTGKYSTSYLTPCQGPYGTGCSAYTNAALLSQDLADVSNVDVKSSVYHIQLNVAQLTSDEIALSRRWMTNNLTGLPTPPVYVYPGGYEDPSMEAIVAGVPYAGARGALHEGGTNNSGQPVLGVKDTYASGFNVQNITSFGVNPSWQGLAPTSLNQKIQALVWKEQVWGVPWGVFWHNQELSSTEITNLIQDFKNAGATIQKNTDLVSWLLTGTQEAGTDGNAYYKSPTANTALDFRPTLNSPVVDMGLNLGTAYEIDINGINQNSYGTGWEIGAHVFAGYSQYGGAGSGSQFTIGLGSAPNYGGATTNANIIQPVTPAPNVGGLVGAGTCVTPADFNLPICRITDAAFDPSKTNFSLETTAGGSGDINLWNTNSTLLTVQNEGSRLYPVAFNPATMQASRLYPTNASYSAEGGFWIGGGGSAWSYANPNLLYVITGALLQSYDFTGYNTGGSPPTATTVYDFTASANCLGSGYTSTWNSYGEGNKYPIADQVFVTGESNGGGQGTGVDVVAYRVGSGCSHLNTQTGAVTGDWGASGTVGISDRFYVHNVKISKDGQWAMVAQATCITTCLSQLPYIWQIGTTNLYYGCESGGDCSGHWTEGMSHLVNNDNSPFYQEESRGYGNNSTPTSLLANLPPGSCSVTQIDMHQNWSNVDLFDSYPFFLSTAASNPAQTPGSYNCAWVNEILGISPTTGTVYRFAHTYATGLNWSFTGTNAIGGVSQDGRFYAFTSDWQGTLGTEGGANGTCMNSPNGSTACRNDVFVVKLSTP